MLARLRSAAWLLLIVGPVEFAQPIWLLLAPALWFVVALLARRSIAGLSGRLRATAIAMRMLVTGAIVAALAHPFIRIESKDVATVIVVDASASVPANKLDAALTTMQARAQTDRQPSDRLGVVTTARDAFVDSLADRRISAIRAQHPGDRAATDLAAGVRLALATLPEDAAGRIVLVSDGADTRGSILATAKAAAGAGVPIDVAPIRYTRASEVALDALIAPTVARRGEPATLRFTLRTTRAVEGDLTLFINDQPVDLDPDAPGVSVRIALHPGVNVQSLPMQFPAGGVQRLRAGFTPARPADDALSANNVAEAVTFVTGEGRVLALADASSAAEPYLDALRAADVNVVVRAPESGFDSLVDLAGFDAVALLDAPAYAFTLAQQEAMRSYVHDLGGGLVIVGGARSFGAGGWIGSPLADAFPVTLDPPQRRQMPKGALAIVLDSSGSMGASVAGAGTKQQAANEAAALAVDSLSRLDLITVLRFTGSFDVVVPLRERGDPGDVGRLVRRIGPGGGTYIYGALGEAFKILRDADASAKHVILLTDGQSQGSPMQGMAIARAMIDNDITLSTVAVGEGADTRLLAALAADGGGRYYELATEQQLRNLPQIFIKEAQTIRRALIWEGDPVAPLRQPVPAEDLRGLGSTFPPITGYIVTAEREGLSIAPLKTPTGDPLLAQWQYGLGRVVAFTSDSGARWSSAWRKWAGGDPFWKQITRWAMRTGGPSNVRVETREDGDDTIVSVKAFDAAGDPLDFASFAGVAIHPNLDAERFSLAQVGPGLYEGRVRTASAGAHLLSFRYEIPGDGGEPASGVLRAASIRRAAAEMRALRDNVPLLMQVAQMTNGRVLADDGSDNDDATTAPLGSDLSLFSRAGLTMPIARTPVWLPVALVALSLFVVDVGVRRVRLDLGAMASAFQRFMFRGTAASAKQANALREARKRAQRRLGDQRRADNDESPVAPALRSDAVRSRKFDARAVDAAATEVALGDAAATTAPLSGTVAVETRTKTEHAPASSAISKTTADEEVGLSRLLQAKRRARQAFADSAPEEHTKRKEEPSP